MYFVSSTSVMCHVAPLLLPLACPFGFLTWFLLRSHSAAVRPRSCLAGSENCGAILRDLRGDMTMEKHEKFVEFFLITLRALLLLLITLKMFGDFHCA
jgi:hypothetical protein